MAKHKRNAVKCHFFRKIINVGAPRMQIRDRRSSLFGSVPSSVYYLMPCMTSHTMIMYT